MRRRQKKSKERSLQKQRKEEIPEQEISVANPLEFKEEQPRELPMPGYERKATEKRKMNVRKKKSNPNQMALMQN